MTKRNFLKTSASLLTSTLAAADAPRKNWAGNLTYKAARLHRPTTLDEVRKIVRTCDQLKALGAKHSFNTVADSATDQISPNFPDSMNLDAKRRTVTVAAGVTYGHLAPYLHRQGFAVHNLASLPHVSVVGAAATATHGSGSGNGNLSTAVNALEIVTANGDVLTLTRERDGDRFKGAVVSLGGLGVVTRITLDVVPAFDVRQTVYRNLSLAQLEKNFEEIFASGYSVSLFTGWQKRTASEVWIKSLASATPAKSEFFGAKAATKKLHPLVGLPAENCTEQLGVAGPWYERLPHFRMDFTPSSGDELQSEFFVPRDKGYEAILAMEKLRDRITPHLLITELRTIAADDLWLSPCYRRDALAIHFTWKPDWPAVKDVLPKIEAALAPFEVRPHWAKLFTLAPARLQAAYPKMAAFRDLLKQHDPGGKFRNAFLDANIFTS
jgi:xylitol oxidase